MEHKPRRKHTTEFQIEALNLAKVLGSFSQAAKQLGISDGLIYNWKLKYKFSIDSKSKSATVAIAESEETKRLRKENEELKKINYILKRAAAFFSQDHLK